MNSEKIIERLNRQIGKFEYLAELENESPKPMYTTQEVLIILENIYGSDCKDYSRMER